MIGVVGYEALGKGRIRVRFDNGISCILYRGELRVYHITEDAVLEDSVYEQLMKETIGKRAKKRALHLLEKMDRTEQQLREKLCRSEYPESVVDDAIAYVKSYHYVDDYRYACNYIQYSQERMSRGQLTQKLMAKGVSREFISSALEECYISDETEQIMKLLEKRHFDPDNMEQKEIQRIYQYILRRGVKSSDILRVMKKVDIRM